MGKFFAIVFVIITLVSVYPSSRTRGGCRSTSPCTVPPLTTRWKRRCSARAFCLSSRSSFSRVSSWCSANSKGRKIKRLAGRRTGLSSRLA